MGLKMHPKFAHTLFLLGLIAVMTMPFYALATKGHPQSAPIIIAQSSPIATKPQPKKLDLGAPLNLKIPSIKIDAAIERVGLTADGAMAAPSDFAEVAWFELGKYPGQTGSAVIAGHYGIKNGKHSVFDDLSKLQPGDTLSVTDDKGLISSFIVRHSQSYAADANTTEVFDSKDGKSHLNLITCEGIWNKTTKSYPKRLVIFTDKE